MMWIGEQGQTRRLIKKFHERETQKKHVANMIILLQRKNIIILDRNLTQVAYDRSQLHKLNAQRTASPVVDSGHARHL